MENGSEFSYDKDVKDNCTIMTLGGVINERTELNGLFDRSFVQEHIGHEGVTEFTNIQLNTRNSDNHLKRN